jgi:hypothetical protein
MASNLPQTNSPKEAQHGDSSEAVDDPFFDLFNDPEENSLEAFPDNFLENFPNNDSEQSVECEPEDLYQDGDLAGNLREPNESLEGASRSSITAVTDTLSIPTPVSSFLSPKLDNWSNVTDDKIIAANWQSEVLSEESSDDESELGIDLAQGFRPIGASLGNSDTNLHGYEQRNSSFARKRVDDILGAIPSPEYVEDLDLREHTSSFGRHFFPWEVPSVHLDEELDDLFPQTTPIEPAQLQMNNSEYLAPIDLLQGNQAVEEASSLHVLTDSSGTKRKRDHNDGRDECRAIKRKNSGAESDFSSSIEFSLDEIDTSFFPALHASSRARDDNGLQGSEELPIDNGSTAKGSFLDDSGFQDGNSPPVGYHMDECFNENVLQEQVPRSQQYVENPGYNQPRLEGQSQDVFYNDGLEQSNCNDVSLSNTEQQHMSFQAYEQPGSDMVQGNIWPSMHKLQSDHRTGKTPQYPLGDLAPIHAGQFGIHQHPHDLSVGELFLEQYERGDESYGGDLFENWQGNHCLEWHLRESFRLFPSLGPDKRGRKKLLGQNGEVVKSELTNEDLDNIDFLSRYLDFPTLKRTDHERYALWGADMRRDMIPRSVNHQRYHRIEGNGKEVYDWKETVSHIQRAHSNVRQRYRDDILGGFLPRYRTADSKRFTEYLTPGILNPDGTKSRHLLPMENLFLVS